MINKIKKLMGKNKIVCCNMKGRRYGDNPKYIVDEIIRRGLDYEVVWLLNEVDDEEVPPEIRKASHNIFSIAYELAASKIWIDSQEGFGLVMLEAMTSELPIVANNSGGISQLIQDGVNGLLCEEKNVEQEQLTESIKKSNRR